MTNQQSLKTCKHATKKRLSTQYQSNSSRRSNSIARKRKKNCRSNVTNVIWRSKLIKLIATTVAQLLSLFLYHRVIISSRQASNLTITVSWISNHHNCQRHLPPPLFRSRSRKPNLRVPATQKGQRELSITTIEEQEGLLATNACSPSVERSESA